MGHTSRWVEGVLAGALVLGLVVATPQSAGAAEDPVPAECTAPTHTVVPGVKLFGTPGNDVILGTDGPDEIDGLGGDDVICGLDGRDVIDGGDGDDWISGGPRRDVLVGGPGEDVLLGGGARDYLRGGDDDDRLVGGSGPDRMRGQDGDDVLVGDGGRDRMWGGHGADLLYGRSGDDRLRGGGGSDDLRGGYGDDECVGESLRACEMTIVSPGDRGRPVRILQRALEEAKLYRGPIDGVYPDDRLEYPGSMTAAIYAFNKLYRDPVGESWTRSDHVGRRWTIQDWRRLLDFTPDPPVARPGEPDRFEVDAHHEVMWLILDGEVAGIFHVSVGGEFTYWWSGTGQYEVAHTPRGDLDVDHYWDGYRSAGWMYRAWYYLYTHRWMAMHGYYTVPPYPASHGCVRVIYDDADWIYARIGGQPASVGIPFHIWDG